MSIKVGINGFGRMGRLVLRAAWDLPELEFVHVNDPAGDATTLAHLLTFDSVHGRWDHDAGAENGAIVVGGRHIATSRNIRIDETDWSGCDLVIEASGIEASGKMKKVEVLNTSLDQGVKRVVVTAPVKEPEVLNVVMGVNDHLYQPQTHRIVTAASCTT
ncbi:MAG: glyceraldehyde 3-phosphate dehydrogenase NAD-binding domain-containing protein, partial [Haliea sp.]